MAKNRQAYKKQYHTYGSVAYKPEYDGSAVRITRGQLVRPEPQPHVRPRRRVVRRPQVQVRPAGTFSPFAIVGIGVVAVCAMLLLVLNAQIMVVNDQTVDLRSQLKTLQAEQESLLAQRELLYDLDAIEAQLTENGTMIQPRSSQITYLIASEPDSIIRFQEREPGLLDNIYEKLKSIFLDLMS